MPGTASMRPRLVDLGWLAFAGANIAAMVRWEAWETVPFHFIWVSLTLLYGFRVWRPVPTASVLVGVAASTGVLIVYDVQMETQERMERAEVPLTLLMSRAMRWHPRPR